jgi:hypothetical protein
MVAITLKKKKRSKEARSIKLERAVPSFSIIFI